MSSRPRAFLIGIASLLLGSASFSGPRPAAEFSAEAVQEGLQGHKSARMYVGKAKVRMDYVVSDQRVIQITDLKRHATIWVLPDARTFVVKQTGAAVSQSLRPVRQSPDASPCEGREGVSCRRLGTEMLDGRAAEKWEVIADQDGQHLRSLYWIDEIRRLPLQEIWPDKTMIRLRRVGTETLGGRATEKWEQRITQPGGQVSQSFQWYDPELEIMTKEVLAGGFYRELRKINVAPQPEDLFTVPPDFRQATELPASIRLPAVPERRSAPPR